MCFVADKFLSITAEGDPNEFFDTTPTPAPQANENTTPAQQDDIIDDPATANPTGRAEDIALVRNQGLDVDDDNEPAPENVPITGVLTDLSVEGLYPSQAWGVDTYVDPLQSRGYSRQPTFAEDISCKSMLEMFCILFSSPLVQGGSDCAD